jgi:hypothetical protein
MGFRSDDSSYVVEEMQVDEHVIALCKQLDIERQETVVLETPVELEEVNRGRVWPEPLNSNAFLWNGGYGV